VGSILTVLTSKIKHLGKLFRGPGNAQGDAFDGMLWLSVKQVRWQRLSDWPAQHGPQEDGQ
jgi:hypothetical protein